MQKRIKLLLSVLMHGMTLPGESEANVREPCENRKESFTLGKGGMRGGFGVKRPNAGSGNNMQQMLRQAQQMQAAMEKDRAALAEKEVEGTSGGGAVTVVMTGDQKLKSVSIKPEVVDPEDVEMLEDLVAAAFNDAAEKVEAMNEETMGKYSAGLGGLM